MLIDHFAMAERHVKQGEIHIQRQREIIAELERGGDDAFRSRALLETFEETLRMHLEDRERIFRAIADYCSQQSRAVEQSLLHGGRSPATGSSPRRAQPSA